MSLVNAETGEVLAEMTPDEARQVTDRIRTALGVAWELVADAYKRRAWAAMGYSSWDDYTSAEFGAARLRLPREERQEVVASLRDAGLSIRAIAASVGVHTDTVQSDLHAGVRNPHTSTPPEVEPQSSAAAPSGEDQGNDSPPGPDSPSDVDAAPPADASEGKITGVDGKQYAARQANPQPKPRRSSLIDAAERAGWEFRKSVERIERVAADDRFAANRDQVAAVLRGHLSYAVEVCQDLLDGFDTSPEED